MINNDILRRLRYTFEFHDHKMTSLFKLGGLDVTPEQIRTWLKKEGDEGFESLPDAPMSMFLNGFIIDKRGNRKDGEKPIIEKRLTNNIILTKLKIALSLQSDDIIELLASVGFNLTKPELSALSRKTDHRHYRECKDQVMRNFLQAIQDKYRESPPPPAKEVEEVIRPKEYKSVIAHSAHPKKQTRPSSDSPKSNRPNTAKPNASKKYVNPNAKPVEKPEADRKVLKLKPEDIWKQ